MTHPVWPASVPRFNRGVREEPGDTAVRFQPSAGPAIVRRRYSGAPTRFVGQMTFKTNAEKSTFETFYNATLLGGVKRFHFPDPNDGCASGNAPSTSDPLWRFRGPPAYSHTFGGDDGITQVYQASVDMERLP